MRQKNRPITAMNSFLQSAFNTISANMRQDIFSTMRMIIYLLCDCAAQ